MLKLSKRLLALSVSVVLSSTVLLAGCGKVEGDADDKAPKKSESIGDSAETALKTVENTAQNIQDMFTGKADKAYSSEIKLSIGKPLAEELGLDDIKDVVFTSDVKAKSGNVETLLGVKYGKDEVISADVIRDDETGNVYLGIPQFSSGYLMMSGDDVDAYISEMTEDLFDIDLDLTGHEDTVTVEDFEVPEMSDEEIEEWLAPYEKAVKDNIPEATSEDKATGEIDGVKYTLDVKSYSISESDAANVITAVVNELKKDENILSMIDEYGATENITRDEFIAELDDMIDSMSVDKDNSETVDIDIYYQDGSIAGLAFNVVDDGDYWTDTEGLDMFWYTTETELCGKLDITDKSVDKEDPEYSYDASMTATISAKLDDGATDVSISVEADDAKMSFVIDDFRIVDEESGAFTGIVTYSMEVEDESLVIKAESKSTSSKLDLSADMTFNGEKYISISITGEETKATDVSIPSGNIYDANDEDQLEAYAATVDTDKFLEDLEKALGEDLYNYLFVGSSGSYYDDWDYGYDYDDWAYWEEEYDYNNDYGDGYADYDNAYTGIGKVIDNAM